MHHHTCGISSLLHSVNLILFTLLDPGSPHPAHITLSQSPHLTISLLQSFTPDLKLISFTNPFLHTRTRPYSIVILMPPGLPSRILNLHWIGRALAFVCFSFFFFIFFWYVWYLYWSLSFITLNSFLVSYLLPSFAWNNVLFEIIVCYAHVHGFTDCSEKNEISKYIANQMSTNK